MAFAGVEDEEMHGADVAPVSAAAAGAASLPWVEKYRPESLSDLVSQGDIISTVTRLIKANRLPHLLLYGPPGTGKTSTILAIAKALYGAKWQAMTLELNASDDRGIDVVREQIKNFASTRKLFSTGVKLVILDEADAMTADAQFALRRVIEKYTKTTRFCLLCNYVSKIIPALQSRCTRFRFAPLKSEEIMSRLQYVMDKEGVASRVTDDGRDAILRLANGDMRKVLNILQSAATGFDAVDAESVYTSTGNPTPGEIESILIALLASPFDEAYAELTKSFTKGYALVDILTEVSRSLATIQLPADARTILLEKLADIEYRLAFGTSDKLQAAALVAAFEVARTALAEHAPA